MKEGRNVGFASRVRKYLWMCGIGLIASGCVEAPHSLTTQQKAPPIQRSSYPLLLEQAHLAYAQGQWRETALLVKQVLQKYRKSPMIQKNALSLLAKAHEQKPAIQTDWSLPKDVKRLEFMTRRGTFQGRLIFHSAIRLRTVHRDTIRQIRLVHSSGRVVLDRKKDIGALHTSYQPGQKDYLHDFYVTDERAPLPRGLYTLELGSEDGTTTVGWFVIDERTYSTRSPEVSLPPTLQAPSLETRLRFPSFHSPQFRAGERRTFYARMMKLSERRHQMVWDLWTAKPQLEMLRVKKKLKPGRYRLYVGYRELRKLGPMYLARISYTLRVFTIRK